MSTKKSKLKSYAVGMSRSFPISTVVMAENVKEAKKLYIYMKLQDRLVVNLSDIHTELIEEEDFVGLDLQELTLF